MAITLRHHTPTRTNRTVRLRSLALEGRDVPAPLTPNRVVALGTSASTVQISWNTPADPTVTGVPTPTVQWQLSTDGGATFTNIAGATSNTYTFTAAMTFNGDRYRAVFTNTVGTASTTSARFIADQPPQVTSVVINSGAAQRSRVTKLTVNFDSPMSLPSNPANAFQLKRQSDNAAVALAATVTTTARTSVTLTFTGGAVNSGSLADGRYTLTALAANLSDPGGNLDGNGTPGDDYVLIGNLTNKLFRLFGDADGNGTVDVLDFGAFRQAFGTTNGVFDFDGSGGVDVLDFGQFRQRFGTAV